MYVHLVLILHQRPQPFLGITVYGVGSRENVSTVSKTVSAVFSELERSMDGEQQISQMKLTFEKQLQTERTLKTQVGAHFTKSLILICSIKLPSNCFKTN